jgi:very-short-patch-repair endonuclease
VSRQFRHQCGVITRAQAISIGISYEAIRSHLRTGRWQRLHPGVYATFSGAVPRDAAIWGILLAAGRDAVISHYTAAELRGLTDESRRPIHVTVPSDRRVAPIAGAVVHCSRRAVVATHPNARPARTRVEETVLDICEMESSLDSAVGWLAAACGRRLTTPDRIMASLADRRKFRRRQQINAALSQVGQGNHSLLELKYHRDVERAHRLPGSSRQTPRERPGGRIFEDVSYDAYRLSVELDGRIAHPADSMLRDMRRDNIATRRGDLVLHYGWDDVTSRPCAVAAEVVAVLSANGWSGRPRRCRRVSCQVA